MYDYGYGYGYGYPDVDTTSSLVGGFLAIVGGVLLVSSIIAIIMIISQWVIFKKAGKKGWEAIIPIYNFVILLEIVGLPLWYIALFFVPFANIYAIFKIYIELAHKFNKSTGFGVLTVFFSFICLPILAFGKNNVYNGNNAQNTQNNNMINTQNNNMINTQNDNNQNEQQSLVFDQNINTEINNIPSTSMNADINTQMNAIQQPDINQTLVFNTTSLVQNQESTINTVPNVGPALQQSAETQPMNIINNQANQPFTNVSEPVNTFMPEQQPIVNQESTLNIVPNVEPVLQQSTETQPMNIINNQANQLFTNISEPVNSFVQGTQPNVIPGMGQTLEPTMPEQNNNNQNN